MNPPAYVSERGDVVWIDFEPRLGHEQGGRRPALVLSPRNYNSKVGLCLVVPITRQAKGYPFEVPIPPGVGVGGVILSDHVRNLDWSARRTDFICRLPDTIIEQVSRKLGQLLPR